MSNRPTHKVLAVSERSDAETSSKSYFTRIGAAWPLKNASGFSIQLDALPVNGRLVVMEIGDEDYESQERSAKKSKTTGGE